MIGNQLEIKVKDSVFDPDLPRSPSSKIYFHIGRNDGKTYYKVWLYLEGNDLPFIESVTYTLHESFREPNQTVRRSSSNSNCKFVIWTWGLFTVRATIVDKKGLTYKVTHQLRYDRELYPKGDPRYIHEEWDASPSDRPTLVSS